MICCRRLGLDDALAEEGTLPGDSGVEDLCQAPLNDVCVRTVISLRPTERGARTNRKESLYACCIVA